MFVTVILVVASVLGAGAWLFFSILGALPPLQFLLKYIFSDIIASLTLGIFLLILQRHNIYAPLIAASVPIVVLIASTAKMLVLGAPAQFGDVFLLESLLLALPSAWSGLIIAGSVAIVVAFLFNLRPPAFALLGGITAVFALFPEQIVHNARSRIVQVSAILPNRLEEFPTFGHFFNAFSIFAEEIEWSYSNNNRTETDHLNLPAIVGEWIRKRNLYVIFLESFIDPNIMQRFTFSTDPFSPLFRHWRDSAPGHSVSPIFGNRSSNSEFELLCGIPSMPSHSAIVFGRIQANAELNCLPRVLQQQGYRTASLVPSAGQFFWAARAYAAAGFQQSIFENAMDMDDRDGIWLSAEATLRQARAAWPQGQTDGPHFRYIFINAGHYPYTSDRTRRPDVVRLEPANALVEAWANAIYHTAVAVEEHVSHLRRADPEALIVILGDHAPPLGAGLAGYIAGGRIEPASDTPPLTRAIMYETPLLVLDGDRFASTGALPTWQVPYLLLDLLSEGATCVSGPCPHRSDRRLRPLPDIILLLDQAGQELARCPWRPSTDDEGCTEVRVMAEAFRQKLYSMLSPMPSALRR